ncbi:MAG TPA: Flp pilus assembly protein CpaB [Rhizomicrobium sp.]|nr:Flp pilus assembly protein CpaB [Rhizomicrobium sp.]
MNTPRLIVLGLAAVAAGGAAFLARGLLGGGTPAVKASLPPPITTSEVLVAASDLAPGQKLAPEQLRWQKWPKNSVDPSFMTQETTPNLETAVKGTVVRSPIVTGEPITATKIVHSDATGFMAATLMPGMRAVSIPVSVASLAGGFILPNDRVDLMLTSQVGGDTKRFRATTFLHNVRVLAIDQAFSDAKNPDKSQKPVSDVKTATLELTPQQAERVARAQASGVLSLSLRPLADHLAVNAGGGQDRVAAARAKYNNGADSSEVGEVSVIRYGVVHPDAASSGE